MAAALRPRLAGGSDDRTAVIIQSATPAAVAPLVTLAHGLSERESQLTRLCMQGLSTRQMAHALALSPHTVQDHLESIFAKTGVRSRSELVGQILLEHYVPRWEDLADVPAGWLAKASPIPALAPVQAPMPPDARSGLARRAALLAMLAWPRRWWESR